MADHRAAVFAHEAGNSLQTIGLAVQLVQLAFETKYPKDVGLDKVIKGALRDVDNLFSLLQEFNTPDHSPSFQLEFVDLTTIVEDVLMMQALACKVSKIVIKFERERTDLRATVDAFKIKQLLINLCKNAREAMPRGGRLTVGLHRCGNDILLEVRDSGGGVPENIKCFELFKSSKSGGSGVGLALAQEIVTAHHGAITYQSEPGHGTTFTVSLPASSSNSRVELAAADTMMAQASLSER